MISKKINIMALVAITAVSTGVYGIYEIMQENQRMDKSVDYEKISKYNTDLEKIRNSDIDLVMSGASADGLFLKVKPSYENADEKIKEIIGNIPYSLEYAEYGHKIPTPDP